MELHLETVALFYLKLAYETEGSSPILRDDLVIEKGTDLFSKEQ